MPGIAKPAPRASVRHSSTDATLSTTPVRRKTATRTSVYSMRPMTHVKVRVISGSGCARTAMPMPRKYSEATRRLLPSPCCSVCAATTAADWHQMRLQAYSQALLRSARRLQ